MLVYDDFAVTNDPTSGIPGRPSLRSELQRRKLLWVTAAVVGLLLGIGLYKEMPPPYKAIAVAHIASVPGVQPTDEILTELWTAQSRKVALMAMRTLGLPDDPKSVQSFMGRETVTSPSPLFVQYTIKASSARDAVTNATALVRAFLLVRNEGLTSWLTKTINSLDKTIATQQQQLVRLSAQIAAVEAQAPSTEQAAKLASLKAKQSQVSGGLKALGGAVKSYAAATRVSNDQVINGSGQFGPTNAVPRSKIKYPALYAVGGLFGGLAIGMGWVIAFALISTRPRRRYDIARALGGPVRLSVGRIRVNKLSARRAPESAGGRRIQQIATHLHGAIRREQRESLAVVALDEPLVPALAIISAALASIRQGKRVMLADLTDGAAAGRLLRCTEPGVYRHAAGQANLTVAIPEDSLTPPTGPIRFSSTAVSLASADPEVDHAYHSVDVLLTLLTIDPGLGADHLSSWASDAVVVLTAGKRSATKIRTTAELIRLSGATLASAVVVGADKFDESLGMLVLPTDDELAEPHEVSVEREARDAQIAQQNGSPERGHPKPEPAERGHVRPEATDRPRAATERRAEMRSEAKSDSRSAPWPEVKSAEVKPASKAETTMPDIRYKAPATQPRPRVDLRKETEKRQPEVPGEPETLTQPRGTRSENAHSPETRPYADANENGAGGQGSRSSVWRG